MPRFDESRAADLIGGFYEAAVQPSLWRSLFADMADALGAEGCGLFPGTDSPFQRACSASLDEMCAIGQLGGWFDGNPRVIRSVKALLASPGEVVTEAMLFSPWELDHLPFHADFLNRLKLRHFAGMLGAGDARTGLGFIAKRADRQGPFSGFELETLRRFVPHIQRAGQLAIRLSAARHDGIVDALAMFDCGAVLLDRGGRVLRLNAKAQAIVGSCLTIKDRRLIAAHGECNAALQKLIGSVIAQGPLQDLTPVGAVAILRPGLRPLAVHAAPLARSAKDLFQLAAAILMILDPSSERVPLEPLLRQAFRFTSAEGEVAAALCKGLDIEEIARLRGVTVATVRAQMKAMFTKTATRRQAEMVTLLLRYASLAR